jgi:hypothetical protein
MVGLATPTHTPSGPRVSRMTWNSCMPVPVYRMVPFTEEGLWDVVFVAVRQFDDNRMSAAWLCVSHSMSASCRGVRLRFRV